jgi:hypothetical protein
MKGTALSSFFKIDSIEINELNMPFSSHFREEGLSNPGAQEHRGLITPPLENHRELAHIRHYFQKGRV